MNWLDYVLIVLLAYSTFRSFRKGFSREIIGLTASLLALILGMWFYGTAASYLAPYIGSARLANLAGFLIVVALVIVAGSLVGRIVRRFLSTVGLSFFDRILGAGFGLLRGLLEPGAVLGQPRSQVLVELVGVLVGQQALVLGWLRQQAGQQPGLAGGADEAVDRGI